MKAKIRNIKEDWEQIVKEVDLGKLIKEVYIDGNYVMPLKESHKIEIIYCNNEENKP